MTAPAAPHIRVNQDGTSLYVAWRPVTDATDYNLYVSEDGGAYGIQAQFADIEVNDDGWFFTVETPFAGIVNVKVTALNVGAEESAASNIVQKNLSGAGAMDPRGYDGPPHAIR